MISMQTVGPHISATYLLLRRGMALIALFFPIVLATGAFVFFNRSLQTSMSAYYYTELRDVFVGVLCAIGAFLFLYKGMSKKEDYALNVAGLCAAGVALFAMDPAGDCRASGGGLSLHGTFAAIFFLAISYVCVFVSTDALDDTVPPTIRARYRKLTKLCGMVMVASVLAALSYTFLLPSDLKSRVCELKVVFWIESVAVWGFSTYWLIKSLEFDYAVSWLPWRRRHGT